MLSNVSFDRPELAVEEIDTLIKDKNILEDKPNIIKIGANGIIL